MKYVVTALDRNKRNTRNVISVPFKTKKRAERFIREHKADNKISIPKYRILHNFRIKKLV